MRNVRHIVVGVLVLCFSLLSALAQQPPAPAAFPPLPPVELAPAVSTPPAEVKTLPKKTIAFVVVGSVDKDMVKRVMDFVAAELHCPLSSKNPITSAMTNSPATQAALLSHLLTSKEACIVALAEEPNAAEAFHGYLDNSLKVGMVNVTALKPANAATPEGAELYGRRLEKEAMRTVGHLIGMESCVEPHCALTPYATLDDLDTSGRNYCPPCQQKAAERLGIRKAGGSIRPLITRLEDLHLIEVFRPWDSEGAKTGGHSPDLVRLTQYGRLAYWLLAGADPAANEYDALLVRHVSPEHTLLNLQVADVLRDAGCQVDLTPPDIHLPGGGLFKPDLLVSDPEGKTLYIEVEAEANKNREQRLAKWRNALQANGGCLYIFCDNRPCMKSVRSEINFALGRNVEQCFMTNLAELQTGKRAVDGGIWLDVRQNKAET